MPMLVHIKLLSLWEIAHYWHGRDPRKSTAHDIPLEVRDTLLVISQGIRKKLSLRVEHDKAYLLEFAKMAPRFTARHYRHTIEKAHDTKIFGKRFFERMLMSRSQLGRWCQSHNEPLPEFWFPDNEKYPFKETGDISDEITENGRYRVQLLYDDTIAESMSLAGQSQSQVEPVIASVNENALKAAQAKHAQTNAIKDRFVAFFKENGGSYKSRKAVAEFFFDNRLDKREQLQFARKEAAVRTLLDGLRADLKQGQ